MDTALHIIMVRNTINIITINIRILDSIIIIIFYIVWIFFTLFFIFLWDGWGIVQDGC